MVATSTLKNKNSECISSSSENYDRRYDHHNYIEDELDFWERCLADPPLGTSSLLTSSSSSSSSSGLRSHSLPEGSLESSACKQLALLLEQCLARAKRSTLHCAEVLVPETLTRRMARDALRLAASEPCGLRGCVLHVQLESAAGSADKKNAVGGGGGGGVCKRLERIVCDASVTPTFELTLVFKQDGGGWPSLRDVLLIGAACFAPGFYRHALKLSPGFRLIKRKLYSSSPAGTIVEEY